VAKPTATPDIIKYKLYSSVPSRTSWSFGLDITYDIQLHVRRFKIALEVPLCGKTWLGKESRTNEDRRAVPAIV
jgi:hypothetical protein